MNPFVGHFTLGQRVLRAGFLAGTAMTLAGNGLMIPPAQAQQNLAQSAAASMPAIVRSELSQELQDDLVKLERGDYVGQDITGLAQNVVNELAEMKSTIARAITSQTANLPVRENLEASATTLLPVDTPFRNRVPRTVGNGAAAVWKQIVSLGGGWSGVSQPGSAADKQVFYSETGKPAQFESVYATRTAAYKLMGAYGGVTSFAAAVGANYQDQRARERRNLLQNFMLNEENAMINAVNTATVAPWGDGTTALAYNGLAASISTANGTPSTAVQATVGPVTLDHYNAQLGRLYDYGGRDMFILQDKDATMWLQKLLRDSDEPYRLTVVDQGEAKIGFRVAIYVHPVTAENVVIITSRFCKSGEIYFGSMTQSNGENAMELEVLPQAPIPPDVQRPDGSRQEIQGYYVTELARTPDQPEVEPFMISLYSTFKMKNGTLFAKSTGVTAPA